MDISGLRLALCNGSEWPGLSRQYDCCGKPGYQFAQARGLLVLDTPIGLAAVIPVGMGFVSSVVMTAEKGKTLYKGEEFCYVQFGGSDHIVMIEAASGVNLTAQLNVHYQKGQVLGYAHPVLGMKRG